MVGPFGRLVSGCWHGVSTVARANGLMVQETAVVSIINTQMNPVRRVEQEKAPVAQPVANVEEEEADPFGPPTARMIREDREIKAWVAEVLRKSNWTFPQK